MKFLVPLRILHILSLLHNRLHMKTFYEIRQRPSFKIELIPGIEFVDRKVQLKILDLKR